MTPRTWILPLCVAVLMGCQHQGPGVPDSLDLAATDDSPGAVSSVPANEHLMGLFDLAIDPGLGSATITPRRTGAAQPPQALSYDLDIDKFLSHATLRVKHISQTNGEVLLTIAHAHPFAAPDYTLPITGKNRQDLSYTGRLLILADQNVATVTVTGEGAYKFDPGWLANPDGYAPVGDLLRTEGLTSNVFPYRLLVDEAADNRVGISNGDVMTGNYDPATGGWQRGNAGANRNGWTGYDYLHQGQSVELTLRINKADLQAAAFRMPLAILIKYTDPRGEPGPFRRFPSEPVDVTQFAYRLPYAALDVSQCAWCDELDVFGQPTTALVSVSLRDWDTGAEEATGTDLSGEADVAKVQAGGGATPIVEVIAPGVLPAPQAMTLEGGTGLPGDELRFSLALQNELDADGAGWMLFRARDPEMTDPAFDQYHFGVDPETILPDAARALPVQTLMPVNTRVWSTPSWVRGYVAGQFQSASSVSITPDNTLLLAAAYRGVQNDQDPASCAQPVQHLGSTDTALQEIDESGNLVRRWVWADASYNALCNAVADGDGNIVLTFSFESEAQNWQPRTIDFDPGPGVDNHTSVRSSMAIVKLDPAGNYLWGGQLDDSKWQGTGWIPGITSAGIAISDSGDIAISGTCHSQIDVDPSPAVTLLDAGSWTDWYITVLDEDGGFLWGLTDSGGEYEYCSPPIWKQNGQVALTGSYTDDMDIDPSAGEQRLPFAERGSGFRVAWSRTGQVMASAAWAYEEDANGAGLAVLEDPTGGEYVVGIVRLTGDLDFTAGVDQYTGVDYPRLFISHYTPAGAYDWSHVLQPEDETAYGDRYNGAAVQPDGTLVFATDAYGYRLDMDPGPGTAYLGTGTGQSYGWAAYNTDGEFQWLRQVDRTGSLFLGELQVAPNGRIVQIWNGLTTQDVDPGPGIAELTLPVYSFGLVYLQSDGTF